MLSTEPAADEAERSEVEIEARAIEAVPYARLEGADRKRWVVRLTVTDVTAGAPKVAAGDTVVVRVHSVVKTFRTDVAELPGAGFRLQYSDGFAADWSGKLSVSPL
jgi:hypothetical protein